MDPISIIFSMLSLKSVLGIIGSIVAAIGLTYFVQKKILRPSYRRLSNLMHTNVFQIAFIVSVGLSVVLALSLAILFYYRCTKLLALFDEVQCLQNKGLLDLEKIYYIEKFLGDSHVGMLYGMHSDQGGYAELLLLLRQYKQLRPSIIKGCCVVLFICFFVNFALQSLVARVKDTYEHDLKIINQHNTKNESDSPDKPSFKDQLLSWFITKQQTPRLEEERQVDTDRSNEFYKIAKRYNFDVKNVVTSDENCKGLKLKDHIMNKHTYRTLYVVSGKMLLMTCLLSVIVVLPGVKFFLELWNEAPIIDSPCVETFISQLQCVILVVFMIVICAEYIEFNTEIASAEQVFDDREEVAACM